MPFFKFRRGDAAAAQPAATAAQTQSVEVLRKRARHRLIGASVLVLLGVAGFPILFETQPRPVAVDIPIEIPGKNAVKPLTVPAPSVATSPLPAKVPVPAPDTTVAAASPVPAEEIYPSKPVSPPANTASSAVKKEVKTEARQDAKVDTKAEIKPKAEPRPEPKVEAKPAPVAESKPAAKPAASGDDGARAAALLSGVAAVQQPSKTLESPKPAVVEESKAASAETKGRMVVQVGAFADAAKADETRRKLEKAGLTTYIQVADTKDGKRIRVRVGPFASKAEAEKAVNKIRSLDLPVAILSF